MEINLYPGNNKNHLNYYTDFLTLNNIRFKIIPSYFGNKIIAYISSDKLQNFSSHSCNFILDFYLKEAVISKIYDEYPLFNTNDASKILSKLSEKISQTPLTDHIHHLILQSRGFNPESYVLFNMKNIMLCVYALTDDICRHLIYNLEKQHFISVIKNFSKLSFSNCKNADVEFSSFDECLVSLDCGKQTAMASDELISYLVMSSPEKVCVKNAILSPELSDIVNQIFNSENNKN